MASPRPTERLPADAAPEAAKPAAKRPQPFFGSMALIAALTPAALLDACETMRVKGDEAHFPVILLLPADWAGMVPAAIEKSGWPAAMFHVVWLPMRLTRLERGAAWWAASRALGGTLVAGL